jgi:ferredoxin-like protein FixX
MPPSRAMIIAGWYNFPNQNGIRQTVRECLECKTCIDASKGSRDVLAGHVISMVGIALRILVVDSCAQKQITVPIG